MRIFANQDAPFAKYPFEARGPFSSMKVYRNPDSTLRWRDCRRPRWPAKVEHATRHSRGIRITSPFRIVAAGIGSHSWEEFTSIARSRGKAGAHFLLNAPAKTIGYTHLARRS